MDTSAAARRPTVSVIIPHYNDLKGLETCLSALERQGRFRDDVTRLTRDLAVRLEGLIRVAPEQWHLQQPNWPSDFAALDAIGKPHARPEVGPSARPGARDVTSSGAAEPGA